MAKYDITYKCGCTDTVQLYGNHENRYRKIEWYKTITCPHCKATAAQAESDKAGLIALTGSDKQIAWANTIRINAMLNIDKLRAAAKQPEIINAWIDSLLAEDSAAYWIDNRYELNGDINIFARYMYNKYNK